MLSKEIERKFLLTKENLNYILVNLEPISSSLIEQFYVIPNSNDFEFRLRKTVNTSVSYEFTTKRGFGLVRDEVNEETNKELYDNYLNKEDTIPIKKIRTNYSLDNDLLLEVDVYLSELDGLLIGEIEFKDKSEADNFIPDFWLGKEVTKNLEYKNKSLWKKINNKN